MTVIIFVIIICEILFFANSAWPADNTASDSRRERCLEILHEGLYDKSNFWLNVHAAEALLYHVYFEGVKENFIARADTAGPEHRIGVWRVLARASGKDAVSYQKYLHLILNAFLDPESPDRLHALETLGKLRYAERLPEIIRIAEEGKGKAKGYARWILANSGDAEDEEYLAELLFSDDKDIYGTAAYALRFLNDIKPETFSLLEQCAGRLPGDAENRVYVVSALFVHAPQENKEFFKKELFACERGKEYERYELGEALAISGNPSDTTLLERLVDDSDGNVRISAANALLRIERRQHRGLRWPDWVVIACYAFGMIGVGLFYMHRTRTGEDFLLGGRKINAIASGMSLFATMISAIGYLSGPGEVIKHGPAIALFSLIAIPFYFIIIGYIVIPFIMRLRIISAYELLEKPLGKGVRLFASIIFVSVRFLWMALLIFLTAKVMVIMMNLDDKFIPVLTVTVGLITVIYSTMGGLRAVVTTDVAQFILLFLGAILTIVIISFKLGGVAEWIPTFWSPNWDKLVVFSLDPHVRMTGVSFMIFAILWWVCTTGSDQMAIQRFISTKDAKAARKAFLTSACAEACLTILLVMVGFALLKYYFINPHHIPDGKNFVRGADYLFPHFFVNFLPIGVSGLVVAGLLSAAMSSLSSGINSTAAVFTSDIIPYLKKQTSDNNNIKVARYASLVVGVLVVILSSIIDKIPGNITEVAGKTSNLFVACLFNLFFMALIVPFATPLGTIIGTLYGITTAILFAFWDVFTGKPGLSFLWILPVSLIVSIFFSVLFSLLPTKGKKISVQLTWAAVLLVPLGVTTLLLLI